MAVAAREFADGLAGRPLNTPPRLGAQKINELAVKRARAYEWRNRLYLENLQYYLGPSRSISGGSGPAIKNADSKGRPLMRTVGDSTLMQSRYFSNRIAPVIDDYRAIYGRTPRIRVPPPDPTAPGAMEVAEKITRYYHSTMQLSDFELQQAELGFFLPTLGDAVYVLEVDPPKKGNGGRVLVSSMNPLYCYPGFMKGARRFQLYDLIIQYQEDPEVLEREYGYEASDNPSSTLLVTYLSPWQRTVCIGKTVLRHVEYDLGFCLAEWVFNKHVGVGTDQAYGQSEIGNVKTLNDFENWARGVAADGLVYATYPLTHIQNIQQFTDDQLEVGPGAVIMSGPDGKVTVAAPTANIEPALKMIEGATQDIYYGSGTTSTRIEGQQHSSIQTGRSIHAAQGPQATRVDMVQETLAIYCQKILGKAAELQERGPFLGDSFEMQARIRGNTFREMFDPRKDLDGWYSVVATWDSMVGVNKQQRIAMASQMLNFGLGDDLEAMDMAGVEDPLAMRKRIENYHAWQQEAQKELGGGGPPGPGGPQPGGPPPPNGGQASAGPGGGGPPQLKQMPFVPPQMAPKPLPQGLPQGVTLDAVGAALRKVVTKLKGTVFAGGDLAMSGQSMKPEIWVSVLADQKVVKEALTPIAPAAKIKFAPEEGMPAESERII